MIALTHAPSPSLAQCELTHISREPIDFDRALEQHAAYCSALRRCGADVRTLAANRHLPDSVFIEDNAIVLDELAVIASMGAASRQSEPLAIATELRHHRDNIRPIAAPATLEGGDVLRVGKTI